MWGLTLVNANACFCFSIQHTNLHWITVSLKLLAPLVILFEKSPFSLYIDSGVRLRSRNTLFSTSLKIDYRFGGITIMHINTRQRSGCEFRRKRCQSEWPNICFGFKWVGQHTNHSYLAENLICVAQGHFLGGIRIRVRDAWWFLLVCLAYWKLTLLSSSRRGTFPGVSPELRIAGCHVAQRERASCQLQTKT